MRPIAQYPTELQLCLALFTPQGVIEFLLENGRTVRCTVTGIEVYGDTVTVSGCYESGDDEFGERYEAQLGEPSMFSELTGG